MENDKKIPVTLDNLHKLISAIPPEQFEKDRKKIEKKMAESHKYWKDKENGKR